MKKLLFGASAVTGLLFASCQQETIPSGQNEGNVSFEVNIPDAIATKGTINDGATIADGTNVNVLHYAIYMTNDGTVNSIDEDGTTPFFQDVVEMTLDQGTRKRSATVNFNLIQDQYYTILFWAQQSAEATGMNAHYELGDLRVISMTTDAVAEGDAYANDESRAAFYAKYEFNTVEKKSHNVTLTRPFSQLNLLTTPESLTISQPGQTTGNYTIDIKQSQVTVTGVATQFDTRAGMAVEESTGAYTFALAQTPEEQGQETLSVGDKNYHYVSMNYFFVPFNEVTDVELDYSIVTTLGAPIKNTVINVPIKKNHRTNLIGNLLTKETTFEIVVDSTFVQPSIDIILPSGDEIVELSDGSVSVATSAAFHEALANAEDGDVIRVAGPVVLPTSISNANSGRLTIVGLVAEASVSFDSKAGSADGGLNCYADGMDLVFQGIRVVSPNTGAAYSGGFGYANSVTFIDCEYVGQYRAVNATTQFIDCTIDPQTSYIYTDSANADFTGCTFNCSEGKGIQVYSDNSAAATVVNVTECTFNAAKQGATWDGKPVTAIDINSIGGKFTVNITNSTAIGFPEGLVSGESLFNIKGGAEYVTVTVDGLQWVSKDRWINEVGDPVVCSADAANSTFENNSFSSVRVFYAGGLLNI